MTERPLSAQPLVPGDDRYRTLIQSINVGFCVIKACFDEAGAASDYVFLEVNPAFEAQTGLADATGKSMKALRPTHEAHWFDIYGRVAKTGVPERFEQRAEALGRWYAVQAFRVGDPAAHEIAILFEDITDRKRIEEHQRILLAELQHRVRNTLAVVRSIARRTAQNSESVEDLSAHFEGRLDAFARVQAMVTRNPEGGVDLAALIDEELLAYAAREGEALRLDGPEVALAAKPAETLSLVIHELTTNAVKHGALSAEGGRVDVSWSKTFRGDGPWLDLAWREGGLSLPAGEPEREGFGFELLRRVLPYELNAQTSVELTPTGLHFSLSMPLGDGAARR